MGLPGLKKPYLWGLPMSLHLYLVFGAHLVGLEPPFFPHVKRVSRLRPGTYLQATSVRPRRKPETNRSGCSHVTENPCRNRSSTNPKGFMYAPVMAGKNRPEMKMYFLLNMVMSFQQSLCVSLPEGMLYVYLH